MEYNEFVAITKNIHGNREHKIKGSYGVQDYYRNYMRIRPKKDKYKLTSSQFYEIFRTLNIRFAEVLAEGEPIKFPHGMGKVEVLKYQADPKLNKEGELVFKVPIDWGSTLKLWYEDEEAKQEKLLIKSNKRKLLHFYYNKSKCFFNNKSVMKFSINRDLKMKIYEKYANNQIDVPLKFL